MSDKDVERAAKRVAALVALFIVWLGVLISWGLIEVILWLGRN